MIIFFDTETTGLDPNVHDIIEIGAVALDDKCKPTNKTFHRRLIIQNPATVEQAALDINGYDPVVWEKSGITASNGLSELNEWLKSVSPDSKPFMAATNAMFDKSFLYSNCDRFKIFPFVDNIWLDLYQIWMTYKMKKGLLSLGNSQEAICNQFDVKNSKAHTALADASAGAECYYKIMEKLTFEK